MYISKKKYDELVKKYPLLLLLEDDPLYALDFAHDLLVAEAEALEECEPYATAAIKGLREASLAVSDLSDGIYGDEFEEGAK